MNSKTFALINSITDSVQVVVLLSSKNTLQILSIILSHVNGSYLGRVNHPTRLYYDVSCN